MHASIFSHRDNICTYSFYFARTRNVTLSKAAAFEEWGQSKRVRTVTLFHLQNGCCVLLVL